MDIKQLNLGETIEILRDRKGLTQLELAEKIKRKKDVVWRLENNQMECSVTLLILLAKVFRVTWVVTENSITAEGRK